MLPPEDLRIAGPAASSDERKLRINEAGGEPRRTCSVRRLFATDADEHAHNLSHWQQLYDQLSAGRFAGRLTELWLDGTQVFREFTSHTVRQSCVVWPDSFWFGIPYSERSDSKIDGKFIGTNAIALRPGACEFELLTPDAFDILGVVVEANELIQYALEVEHMDPLSMLHGREILHVGAHAKRRFANFVLETLSAMERNDAVQFSPAAKRNLQHAILSNLVTLFSVVGNEPKTSVANINRQRLVSRVREFVIDQHEQAITVPDLCRQFHVSRRTLQNCFYEVLDVSPVAYLRSIRLNSVRRELKNIESHYDTVQEVATAWGFWHLSQFASDYKQLFDERPSESLRARTQSRFVHRL